WVFTVAKRAASRAAKRDVCQYAIEPQVMANWVEDAEGDEPPSHIRDALNQLTEQQRAAVELCLLGRMSQRDAATDMGIAPGTLTDHLGAAKKRLKEILSARVTRAGCRVIFTPGAQDT